MNIVRTCLLVLLAGLVACTPSANGEKQQPGANIVTVIGAIHGQHRRSTSYSLDVLEKAIVKFNADIVMIELPPERFAKAAANYDRYGEVRESRADDFPELVDVAFPLQKRLGFEIIPVAAWTQEIADNRRATMSRLEKDPNRESDWAKHQAAITTYGRAVSGRSDDPLFIHSESYDKAVKERQETYERLFGQDLGGGGWQAINSAHYAQVDAALNEFAGQGKRILILYGAWHKYWFLEALEARDDIQVVNARRWFAR